MARILRVKGGGWRWRLHTFPNSALSVISCSALGTAVVALVISVALMAPLARPLTGTTAFARKQKNTTALLQGNAMSVMSWIALRAA